MNIYIYIIFFILFSLTLYNYEIMSNIRKLCYWIIILLYIFILLLKYEFEYYWLQELFWYTYLLNLSFIFHILILQNIFKYYYFRKEEYKCFIISKISFIFSLTFIYYLIEMIILNIYIKKLLDFSNNFFIFKYLELILRIISLIIFWFIYKIHLYYNFISGSYNIIDWKIINWKNLLLYYFILRWIIIIIFSFIIMLYTGIPRLYIIWISIFIYKIIWYIGRFIFNIKLEYLLKRNELTFINIYNNLDLRLYNFKYENIRDKLIGIMKWKLYKNLNEIYHKSYEYVPFIFLSTQSVWWVNLSYSLYTPSYWSIVENYWKDIKWYEFISWKEWCIKMILKISIYNLSEYGGNYGIPKNDLNWKNDSEKFIIFFSKQWLQNEEEIKQIFKEEIDKLKLYEEPGGIWFYPKLLEE